MEEIEKLREIERAEPEKLKERTRLRREKEKVDEFEKFTVECPECKSHTLVRDYERAELVCSDCGLVIDEIMKALDVKEIEICPWALREGAILRWLDQFGRTRLGF